MTKELTNINSQIRDLVTVSQNLTSTIVQHDALLVEHKKDIAELKKFKDETWTINTYQQFELKEKAHSHVGQLVREKHPNLSQKEFNKQFRPLISSLWREFKPAFQVPRYSMTRMKDFERAVDWVEHWTPTNVVFINDVDRQRKDAFDALVTGVNETAVTVR